MPASHLRCTQCGTERPLEGVSACDRCFAPLEPVYDVDPLHVARRSPPARRRCGATRRCCRSHRPSPRCSRPASRRSSPRRAWPTSSASASSISSSTPPTRPTRSRTASSPSPSAKAQELGLEALACASTGNLANAVAARAAVEGLPGRDLLPGRRRAREAARQRGARRDHLRRPRQLRRVQPADDRAVVRAAVGVRQRDAARLLRGGLEDARVRGRRAARLGAAGRGRRPGRIGLAALADGARLRGLPAARSGGRPGAAADRVAAGGVLARRDGVRRRPARARPCGRTRSRGRWRSATRPTATRRSRRCAARAVPSTPCPRTEIGENMLLLASTTGVFGETAAGVTLGALRAAVAAGEVGPNDRVVLFVTGDGLKTLAPVGRPAPPGRDRAGRGRSARCAPRRRVKMCQ